MGLKATVNINGLSGELYLTIITDTNEKYAGVTRFLVRGFESRDILYSHIAGDTEGNIIAFEKEYEMPLIDVDSGGRSQMYAWLKENYFPEAIDDI